MNRVKIVLFMAFVIQVSNLSGQTEIVEENNYWAGYIVKARISNRFSIFNDAHIVPDFFILVRPGLMYHFNNKLNMTTTLGYNHLWLGEDFKKEENQIWGEVTASHKSNNFSFYHRIRPEARFKQKTTDGHTFNWRFRYMFKPKYTFYKNSENKTKWYAYGVEEILFNAGDDDVIVNNFQLDQNRIGLGLGYSIKNTTFQLGYLNFTSYYPPKTADADKKFKVRHLAQFVIYHNFDFRKKDKK
ncbi:MAG: DUF2490 domain-containing protein [Flavobacteriales bacterium]|nr:DUF2490 domain-containing protein [Flavobacteriales bacterium]